MKRDQDKLSELNQQLMKLAKREEKARKELTEQRISAEALAASLAEKLKSAQKDKNDTEAALDQVDGFTDKGNVDLYSASLRTSLMRSDMDHTVLPANNTISAFTHSLSPAAPPCIYT